MQCRLQLWRQHEGEEKPAERRHRVVGRRLTGAVLLSCAAVLVAECVCCSLKRRTETGMQRRSQRCRPRYDSCCMEMFARSILCRKPQHKLIPVRVLLD